MPSGCVAAWTRGSRWQAVLWHYYRSNMCTCTTPQPLLRGLLAWLSTAVERQLRLLIRRSVICRREERREPPAAADVRCHRLQPWRRPCAAPRRCCGEENGLSCASVRQRAVSQIPSFTIRAAGMESQCASEQNKAKSFDFVVTSPSLAHAHIDEGKEADARRQQNREQDCHELQGVRVGDKGVSTQVTTEPLKGHL